MKSKFQKKKDREREVRKKILARRMYKHLQEKEEAKLEEKPEKLEPIRNDPNRLSERAVRKKMEKNAKILAGLQAEYEKTAANMDEEMLLPEEIAIAGGPKPTLAEKAAVRLKNANIASPNNINK